VATHDIHGALGLLLVGIAGCAPSLEQAAPHPLPGSIAIEPASAEVWSFDLAVTARPRERAQTCEFDVDGRSTSAEAREDAFHATLSLAPGPHRVTAVCRIAGTVQRSAVMTYTVRLRDAPKARAVAHAEHDGLLLDGSRTAPAERSHAPLVRYRWFARAGLDRAEQLLGEGQSIRIPVPPRGEYTYSLAVTDAGGETGRAAVGVDVGTEAAVTILGPGAAPSWTSSGVVYGVYPPLYGEAPLRAVRAALPSFSDLGVAALWLSPVFDAPDDDFGYAVTDYFHVRANLGTDAELRELVQEAHVAGIRVVLDLVPNHTSDQHRYFRQAAQLGSASHYYGFYERAADGEPTHYFDWLNLPNLAYSNPEVQRWMTAVALQWCDRMAIDGYRVDAVWGVHRRAPPGFIETWLGELYRVAPRSLVLAEASARDPYYGRAGFSASYDWTEELGHAAWEHVFDTEDGIAARFGRAVRDTEATRGTGRVFRFLNNNDTGARFVTRHGIELTRVATVALLTLPGIPSLYSFDEGGAEYDPYTAGANVVRTPHPELVPFHRELIRLRRTVPALQGDDLQILRVGSRDEGFAYLRRGNAGSASAVVVLNFGKIESTSTLDLATAGLSRPRIIFASPRARLLRGGSVLVEPFGYAVLVSD
jgi:glycosidase